MPVFVHCFHNTEHNLANCRELHVFKEKCWLSLGRRMLGLEGSLLTTLVLGKQKRFAGRAGPTEVTPDQTIFERPHVPSALELQGLEKASSAL